MTPDSNRLPYYRLGYGDGAKGSAHRFPFSPDYMRGYHCGTADAAASAVAFCEAEGLELPGPTREPVPMVPASGVLPCPVATPTVSEIVGGGKA